MYFLKTYIIVPNTTSAYPASPKHIPKNIQKNGASKGVGSIPLYLGDEYNSVKMLNGLTKFPLLNNDGGSSSGSGSLNVKSISGLIASIFAFIS